MDGPKGMEGTKLNQEIQGLELIGRRQEAIIAEQGSNLARQQEIIRSVWGQVAALQSELQVLRKAHATAKEKTLSWEQTRATHMAEIRTHVQTSSDDRQQILDGKRSLAALAGELIAAWVENRELKDKYETDGVLKRRKTTTPSSIVSCGLSHGSTDLSGNGGHVRRPDSLKQVAVQRVDATPGYRRTS